MKKLSCLHLKALPLNILMAVTLKQYHMLLIRVLTVALMVQVHNICHF